MSFVRTLATLAAGFAAAKGVEQYRKMGGMAGLQDKLKSNEQVAQMTSQLDAMMEKMGVPGGTAKLQEMMARMGQGADRAGEAATAGLAGLMAALGGAAAAGTGQATQMMDALTGTGAASATMEENAKLMIRAMIQAAKSDGEIDPAEREKILSVMGDLSDEERAFVEEQLAAPVDPVALAGDTQEAMRAQVYAAAATAIHVDSPAEEAFLSNLARALGLDSQKVARIRAAMGLPA
ncbi:DUF533 domain-containing protein [Rhodovulum euryhalinum]|uniref:Uncharacterized membrane protein YebE (DUF533 family) n=1 Tax=Rhodovulum euryhalinum TaxID=35805 RepID=A0A4R2KT93_9RHOB|nr:DUF533 domain-containing protein [Rhodovulum euryhalinum]TCO69905.1 uncharacterized membrane protein YebE (DUF533 family) [Rhodovulum euryhalinum]